MVMDATLSKLRLTPPAVKVLEEIGIEDFSALVGSDRALQLLRLHLNPIQQSKLNAFIKEFESSQDERECDNGDRILVNSELKATRQEIISQLDLERQCLEEINSLILAEPTIIRDGAKQILQKSKAAHQSRASRLNAILRSKPTDGICSGAEPEDKQFPSTLRKTKRKVQFPKLLEKPKRGPKNAIYNSPRAREGVHNSIFSSASVFGAFAVAKDVFTDFISGVASGGKQQRDEPVVDGTVKLTKEPTVEEPRMRPVKSRHNPCSNQRPAKRAVVEPLADEPLSFNPDTSICTSAIHSYHTHTAVQLDSKPDAQLSSLQPSDPLPPQASSTAATAAQSIVTPVTESSPAHSRSDAMDDIDYVSVSTADQLHQQNLTREWRESLLARLGSLCYQFAQCNYNCELLHQSRQEWMRAGVALDLESMRRYTAKTQFEVWRERRRHEIAGMDLRMKEGERWDAAYAARNNLLEWNREAMRLNLSLAVNPHVDQALWLQAVDVHTDYNGYITAMMQHSRQVLVQPGEYCLACIYEFRVIHAQYTLC